MPKKICVFLITALFLPVLVWSVEFVNINNASIEQLDNLTGIGPIIGQKIIDNRPYASVNDLLKVPGIGEKSLEKIKQQGIVCVDCPIATNSIKQIANSTESANSIKPIANSQLLEVLEVQPPKIEKNVFINEVLASPTGPDADGEWIELYNANNIVVDLSGWKIRDTIGVVKTYTFPENTKIVANGFLILTRPQTKITLQNSGDGLELLNPNGKIVDKVEFGTASQDQAWARLDNGQYKWTTKLTPGETNTFTTNSTQTANSIKQIANGNGQSSEVSPQRIADIKETSANTPKTLFNFLIGLFVAASSAVIVFILYKKFSPDQPNSFLDRV